MSGGGSPGPDGIPYKAWRRLGEVGADILHEAMADLMKHDAVENLKAAHAANRDEELEQQGQPPSQPSEPPRPPAQAPQQPRGRCPRPPAQAPQQL
eukprot:12796410-Heterocapsa_arctica.AAC.1